MPQPKSQAGPNAASRLKRIVLFLARTREFPNGSSAHGYDFLAPLDNDQRLDPAAWRGLKNDCVARRFWGDGGEETGRLTHRAGGEGGATWTFDYDPEDMDDDDPGYRLGDHHFVEGEYVSIEAPGAHIAVVGGDAYASVHGDDKLLHTFQVRAVLSDIDRAAVMPVKLAVHWQSEESI